ncbi:hypothetical protein BO86DRAFT_429970 [Aspergillus japonicus CBS 114.51]|uniref:Uncharacterized protein n=1 Tax=Aspergillus japonicus CBS 114.51 TaxID=1448312 RepID=A0A8T8X1C0_ASPJA|nr:hypothetical protein BO86DRAFT_429970 [Aspergillus japonicus CBS 114.51]RAH81937.1 hypothetical protein BO86DRAFT_429970 [Aspergillus japonicus CBS 114.51]
MAPCSSECQNGYWTCVCHGGKWTCHLCNGSGELENAWEGKTSSEGWANGRGFTAERSNKCGLCGGSGQKPAQDILQCFLLFTFRNMFYTQSSHGLTTGDLGEASPSRGGRPSPAADPGQSLLQGQSGVFVLVLALASRTQRIGQQEPKHRFENGASIGRVDDGDHLNRVEQSRVETQW